jgi:hypothetical protein
MKEQYWTYKGKTKVLYIKMLKAIAERCSVTPLKCLCCGDLWHAAIILVILQEVLQKKLSLLDLT